MRNLLFFPLLVLLSLPLIATGEPIKTVYGRVTKVSDGDTIHIQQSNGTKLRVRMNFIDAPETEKRNKKTGKISKPGQPYGEEALMALKSKIYGQEVKFDILGIDKYQRPFGIIYLDDRNINQEMVSEGFAWAYRQYLEAPYASAFIKAEEQARREMRGLWQQPNPEPPWEFRHRNNIGMKKKKRKFSHG